jgi:aminoglycoside/choline kinase family phosphotransferase
MTKWGTVETPTSWSGQVPLAVGQITPDWLTQTLRDSRALTVGEVSACSSSPIGEGFGMCCSLLRVELAYDTDAADGPRSLVAKIPHSATVNRETARQYRLYEREAGFFRDIAATIATRIPAVYGVAFDRDSGYGVVLIEDLCDYRPGNQLVPATEAEVDIVVGQAAALHAAYWGRSDAALGWLPSFADPLWMQLGDAFPGFWSVFEERFPETVTPTITKVAERYSAVLPKLGEQLSRGPSTLVHGDFKLDNFFFGERPGQADVIVGDWQMITRGSGLFDLGYFLSQSVDPRQRLRTERDVVRRYCDALASRGVTCYSIDDCWADYRAAVLWTFIYPVSAGAMDLSNERSVAMAKAMSERCFAALEELEVVELLD